MIRLFQIDAFTDTQFKGNPAAVCPLDNWLDTEVMQQIAAENNLAETAFFVQKGEYFEIRWFTPTVEVDLCGHATLASAYVLFNELGYEADTIRFYSERSGDLGVSRQNDWLTLDFPADVVAQVNITAAFADALGVAPTAIYEGKSDFMIVVESEQDIKNLEPDMSKVAQLGNRGVIVTAKGNEVDFVSRFFAPQSGIDEDPVTGSAHTTLAPYWAGVFGKSELTAKQLSQRGGDLKCQVVQDRVLISGKACKYMEGSISI
ncbi:PhzF family phenazine biosynthesis protein [Limibacter armeniacum]|uniref:PhzF family phenazine biosynthesis protein n=1 Tax=Limibacter armeniacum TaxID=466084 RepID=UPI002FE54145